MRATLIVNPAAGNAHVLLDRLAAIGAVLGEHGFEAEVLATTATADSARDLAAAAAGSSTLVIACGGDGTVHDVVQGLAGTATPLGVLPLGTANALARNLRLPMEPIAALTRLLSYEPRSIPLGQIRSATAARWFAVMAGCGPDGALVQTLSEASSPTSKLRIKSRLGRNAYYAHAAMLFLTRRWPEFSVEFAVDGEWASVKAVGLMCSRVPDLGGLFSGLTPGSSLSSLRLRVQVLHAPAEISFPAWFTLSRAGLPNAWLTTVEVDEVRCTPLSDEPVYAQADAEALGPLPLTLRVVPEALRLLMPKGAD